MPWTLKQWALNNAETCQHLCHDLVQRWWPTLFMDFLHIVDPYASELNLRAACCVISLHLACVMCVCQHVMQLRMAIWFQEVCYCHPITFTFIKITLHNIHKCGEVIEFLGSLTLAKEQLQKLNKQDLISRNLLNSALNVTNNWKITVPQDKVPKIAHSLSRGFLLITVFCKYDPYSQLRSQGQHPPCIYSVRLPSIRLSLGKHVSVIYHPHNCINL